jgi:hypothetical protein
MLCFIIAQPWIRPIKSQELRPSIGAYYIFSKPLRRVQTVGPYFSVLLYRSAPLVHLYYINGLQLMYELLVIFEFLDLSFSCSY